MASKLLLVIINLLTINSLNCSKLVAPKLNLFTDQVTQDEGGNFQMLCSVGKGSEPFFFEWSKNGLLIKPGPDIKPRIENSQISSTLTIVKVARSDAGNYSCLVRNAVGSDSQSVLLIVKGLCQNSVY